MFELRYNAVYLYKLKLCNVGSRSVHAYSTYINSQNSYNDTLILLVALFNEFR